ncbi:MAG: DUF177 domain-containing protein [Acidobacteria bacterium]|nr:DUF177 domain-containing protein [Acidobacteriota bacterium]
MFIEIEDLRDEPLHVRHTYGLGEIAFKRADAVLAEPVLTDFILTHKDRDLHVDGSVKTILRCRCARCASEFRREIVARFELSYAPHPGNIKENEEIELKYEDMDIGFYDGVRLDVDLMVAEQIELSLPMKLVCRDECRGLCYRCGRDLNDGPCGCAQEERDARLSVLLEFRKKMDE